MRSNRVSDFSFPGAPSLRAGNPFRRLVGLGASCKAAHKTALHFEYMCTPFFVMFDSCVYFGFMIFLVRNQKYIVNQKCFKTRGILLRVSWYAHIILRFRCIVNGITTKI